MTTNRLAPWAGHIGFLARHRLSMVSSMRCAQRAARRVGSGLRVLASSQVLAQMPVTTPCNAA